MEQEQQEQPKYRVVPVHTPSLTHALSIAMTRGIMVWRDAETGTPFSLKELFEFAKRHDKEHPLKEHYFYMVTREGAIGISPGLEWLTTWMFVPMEDCKERDFMLLKMREDLECDRAVRAAVEKAVTEGLAREKAEKEEKAKQAAQAEEAAKAAQQAVPTPPAAPAPQPAQSAAAEPAEPQLVMNFCPNCGTKLLPGDKFCTHCGTRVR